MPEHPHTQAPSTRSEATTPQTNREGTSTSGSGHDPSRAAPPRGGLDGPLKTALQSTNFDGGQKILRPIDKQGVVTASSLWLRGAPRIGPTSSKIKTYPKGTPLHLTGDVQTGDASYPHWYEVEARGRKGFMAADFVSEGAPGTHGPSPHGGATGSGRTSGSSGSSGSVVADDTTGSEQDPSSRFVSRTVQKDGEGTTTAKVRSAPSTDASTKGVILPGLDVRVERSLTPRARSGGQGWYQVSKNFGVFTGRGFVPEPTIRLLPTSSGGDQSGLSWTGHLKQMHVAGEFHQGGAITNTLGQALIDTYKKMRRVYTDPRDAERRRLQRSLGSALFTGTGDRVPISLATRTRAAICMHFSYFVLRHQRQLLEMNRSIADYATYKSRVKGMLTDWFFNDFSTFRVNPATSVVGGAPQSEVDNRGKNFKGMSIARKASILKTMDLQGLVKLWTGTHHFVAEVQGTTLHPHDHYFQNGKPRAWSNEPVDLNAPTKTANNRTLMAKLTSVWEAKAQFR